MRLISRSSVSPTLPPALSKPITQAPMRSIRRRAGWSMVAKKSGSVTATRRTGICRRANQTRTAAGMRSSVRMLWNNRATISIVARSSGVAAAFLSCCLRWCSSSSITGVVTSGSPRRVVGAMRCRMPCCAVSMARARPGDNAGPGRCSPCDRVECPKSGTCLPMSRFKRPSTASACSRLRASGAVRVIMRVSSPTPSRPL